MNNLKRIFCLYASMFAKRDDSIFAFGSWFGQKFSDNPKYLFIYCLKQGIRCYWITDNDEVYKKMKKDKYPVVLDGTPESKEISLKAKYFVVCTSAGDANKFYIGNAIIINLWHGIPLKKIVYDDEITRKDQKFLDKVKNTIKKIPERNQYYFSTSPAITKIYKSCFRTDDKHIIEIGQARNDCFFDGSLKKQKYASIDYDKTIFYMPTHRNEGKTKIDITKIFDLQKLNKFCQDHRALFIVKKHFYHREEISDLKGYSNIVDLTRENLDSQESLFNADILVSDYSSCYIDYLLLNRPVVFYNYDYENYLINDREMYFDYNDVTPGPKAKTFDEFLKALEYSLDGNYEYKGKLEEVKNFFYSKNNQGQVCSQILEAIGKLK